MQATLFNQHSFEIDIKRMSRYIQTTWRFSAVDRLEIKDMKVSIRPFSEGEALSLAELARKKNLFVRKDQMFRFYTTRIWSLANNTVIEVFRRGHPDAMIYEAQIVADLIEELALLSSVLVMSRKFLQNLLGISYERQSEFNITIGPDFYYLRSKSRPVPLVKRITIDEKFCRRFERCGFSQLAKFCVSDNNLAGRLRLALAWIFESRHEPVLSAALIKTAIALESLLIFSESEFLAGSLSERAAFILSSDPDIRKVVFRIVKKFYDARSGVVHGSRKKAKKLTLSLVEGVDRLTLLLCLIIASNSDKWNSTESLREWCEKQRLGSPDPDIHIPFPHLYLRNAINLAFKGNE